MSKKPRLVPKRDAPTPVSPAPEKKPAPSPKPPVRAPRKPAAPREKKPAAPRTSRSAAPAVKSGPEPVAAPRAALPRLSVFVVTSEAHPFAKTGGLAEVAAALPDALGRLGHTVTLVVPRYRGVDAAGAETTRASVRLGSRVHEVAFHAKAVSPGVTAVLVDIPELFDRRGLYGEDGLDYPDNAWRFAVFSRAALEYARLSGRRPSIIHAHDWQTGLVPVFQKMLFSTDPIVGGVPAVFTIHNLAFQGVFPAATVPAIGLGWEVLDMQALEYWGQISYLKGGINFSERLTTVSPTYAREILTPELGFGLDGVLSRRADALTGILNGIDVERWNPSNDPLIGAAYDPSNMAGKAAARQVLLEAVGLPVVANNDRPVIGLISRLTDQKGFDLIAAAAGDLMRLDAAWVLLGSGEARYEDLWRALAASYPGRVSATIGFDERLAHRIEAGSDLFLMPSRFEPCGLNQMYSLRYGTLPIVRATGGLEDTVRDAADPDGNGFKFREYSPQALVATVTRALELFPKSLAWKKIQQRGMAEDHSWDASAREYVKVYGEILGG